MHKSPDLPSDADGNPKRKRLVLKVDLAEQRPNQ